MIWRPKRRTRWLTIFVDGRDHLGNGVVQASIPADFAVVAGRIAQEWDAGDYTVVVMEVPKENADGS